jgi:hypothetical protein
MRLIIIGTDHRLQQTIVQNDQTKAWIPRSGGHRYHRLIAYCIEKLGAKVILEETDVNQDRIAPTIGSAIARERGLVWQCIGLGEPGLSDCLMDPPNRPSDGLGSQTVFTCRNLRFERTKGS